MKKAVSWLLVRWRPAAGIMLMLVAWELLPRYLIRNKLILVPFSEVAIKLVDLFQTGELIRHMLTSLTEFLLGFGLATVTGVILGMVLGVSRPLREISEPVISAANATPTVALAPMLIMWLGIGINSKIAVAFLLAVIPIILSTAAGIETSDSRLVKAAHVFGATRAQIFTKVLVPAALPMIVSGLRIAVGKALVGVVVGELFAARAGLGFLISISSQSFDVAGLLAGVLVLAVTGMLSVGGLRWLELWLAPWREDQKVAL